MYDRFKELGVPVAITRSDDESLTRAERLRKMTNTFGNDSKVLVLSNHINAGGANGKNVGKVSSILFALKYKDFGLMLKFFLTYIVKKFVS